MPKKIPDGETEVLMELWRALTPVPTIATRLHISRQSVYARLRRLREQNHIVDSRPRGSRNYIPSARRIAALKNLPVLWESSASTQEIAEKIHYSVPQTFAFARLLKLPSRHRRHQKPLDEHRQAAIVILRESEWVFEDIAAILTISRQRAHQLWTKAQKQKTS